MTERRESLTADDRALLRRRALFVVPVGVAIGSVAVWMIGWGTGGLPVVIRGVFGVFFFGALLFILSVHVGASFEREKVIRRGIVTGKRVGIVGPSMDSNARSSPRYYLSLDGEESSVEQWVYRRVHTGQSVDLMYTARLQNLFAVSVIADPGGVDGVVAMGKPFDVASMAHDEALTDEDRMVLRGYVVQALVRRVLGGAVIGSVLAAVLVLAWFVVLAPLTRDSGLDRWGVLWLAPGTGILLFAALNHRSYLLLRDVFGGRKHVADEIVRDVVRSNTPLLSPTIVVTGTGLAGAYSWVQTDSRWARVDERISASLGRGDTIRVVTAPRSGVVLGLAGQGAFRVGLGAFDWLLIFGTIGVTACLLSPN